MDKIGKYVKAVTRNADMEPAELKQLRAEIRNHLAESVNDLRKRGMSEEESITIALQRFGERRQIRAELKTAYPSRPKAGKRFVAAAVLFLTLAFLLGAVQQYMLYMNRTDYDGMQRDYHQRLKVMLEADGEGTAQEVEAFFHRNERILRFVSVSPAGADLRSAEPVTIYPADVPKERRNEQPYISYPVRAADGGPRWDVIVALNGRVVFSEVPGLLGAAAVACFAAYWILYGLGHSIRVYRQGRLHAGWVALFMTLNVLAPVLYRWTGRLESRKPVAVRQ